MSPKTHARTHARTRTRTLPVNAPIKVCVCNCHLHNYTQHTSAILSGQCIIGKYFIKRAQAQSSTTARRRHSRDKPHSATQTRPIITRLYMACTCADGCVALVARSRCPITTRPGIIIRSRIIRSGCQLKQKNHNTIILMPNLGSGSNLPPLFRLQPVETFSPLPSSFFIL